MPAALAVDWEQIKQAAIAGVEFKTLAERWDIRDKEGKVTTNPIRQRAFLEKWPIPRVIIDKAKAQLAKTKALTESDSSANTGNRLTAFNVIEDELRRNGLDSSLRASQIALKSIQSAPDKLPCVDASDLKTLLSVARNAAGMDKAQAEVKVNLAMFQGLAQAGQAGSWEVDPVTDETQE